MADPIDDARATLLRALEQIEGAGDEVEGEVTRADVVVVYAVGGAWHDVGGWTGTPGPAWSHAALLRHAAENLSAAPRPAEDD